MKKIPIYLILIVLYVVGCSQKNDGPNYVELTKEMFEGMDISTVKSVKFLSMPLKMEDDPAKIKIIYDCIKKGDPGDPTDKYMFDKIMFTTEDTVYYTGFNKTAEKAFGYWWESKELLEIFNEWESKPDGPVDPSFGVRESPFNEPLDGMLK